MTICGIDASTTSTGLSIFVDGKLIDYTCIKASGDDWHCRLTEQGKEIQVYLDKYHPDKIILEDVPLKATNVKALVILGAVQGYILGVASQNHIPIQLILPTEWRSAMGLYNGTENGKKRVFLKQKSVEYVNKHFGLNLKWVSANSKFNDDDIADAILIAYSIVKKAPK